MKRILSVSVILSLCLSAMNLMARGGGGCFLPETPILHPDGSVSPISQIEAGTPVLAFALDGQVVTSTVREVVSHPVEEYRIVEAAGVVLHVTADHPVFTGQGRFVTVAGLERGDTVYVVNGRTLQPVKIEAIRPVKAAVLVYNLHTAAPNTYFAGGLAVHNKGGGGGGRSGGGSRGGGFRGGSSRGGSGGGGQGSPWPALSIFGLIFALFIIIKICEKNQNENLDFIYNPAVVAKKRDKTVKLLEFIAKQDPTMSPQALITVAGDTFRLLQKCWQNREYGPMRPLMMADLYQDHCSQLEGMRRHHEINMIEGVKIDRIELVNVRYTFKANQREFTALMTATAKDYYVDDRTLRKTRGDDRPEQFQEFWTFQFAEKGWRLREIEQSRESRVLKEDNFFEQFTDQGLDQIYGGLASDKGKAGPWLEKQVDIKGTRIERMLNFLMQTDKMWDRQEMLETSRRVFLELMVAWESGTVTQQIAADLFPDLETSLREQVDLNHRQQVVLEFRNLCVRKVELILVRNFTENEKDEFVVRVRAHAQRIMLRAGSVVSRDEDVVPFEQYLTFGRMKAAGGIEKRWRLKEIVPEGKGSSLVVCENLDQDSNLQQLQWYYQHKRAL